MGPSVPHIHGWSINFNFMGMKNQSILVCCLHFCSLDLQYHRFSSQLTKVYPGKCSESISPLFSTKQHLARMLDFSKVHKTLQDSQTIYIFLSQTIYISLNCTSWTCTFELAENAQQLGVKIREYHQQETKRNLKFYHYKYGGFTKLPPSRWVLQNPH